jgi:DNA-binding NarL/FixJ family response regulator
MGSVSPYRTYIVYRHGLFAKGIRSLLDEQASVQIVGMENDADQALKAVRSLKPDVIILEAAVPKRESDRLAIFLQSATTGRVVRLSLQDEHATVYRQSHVPAGTPGDLVKAIRGAATLRRSAAANRRRLPHDARDVSIAPPAEPRTSGTRTTQPAARLARQQERRDGRGSKRH